jgi:protein phosphatase
VEACALTDVGCVRKENQDSVLLVNPPLGQPRSELGVLAIVADGMGATTRVGRRAARREIISLLLRAWHRGSLELAGSTARANTEVFEAAKTDPALLGMGTTLTVVLVRENRAYVAHVGDSRAYRVARRHRQITEDHTVSEPRARRHRCGRSSTDKHLITRAVGAAPDGDTAAERRGRPGDVFVLHRRPAIW